MLKARSTCWVVLFAHFSHDSTDSLKHNSHYMHTDVLQYVQSRLNAVIQAFDMSAPAHVAMELGNQVQRKTPDWKMTDQTAGPEKNHRSGRKAGEARRLFAWSCGFASPAMHPSFPDRLFSSRLVRLFLKTISHPHNIYIALKNNWRKPA